MAPGQGTTGVYRSPLDGPQPASATAALSLYTHRDKVPIAALIVLILLEGSYHCHNVVCSTVTQLLWNANSHSSIPKEHFLLPTTL